MSSSISPPKLSQSYIDENIGNRLINTAAALVALDTVFVALRCWSRYLQKAPLGWDDMLIVPAYISCLAPCICSILSVKYGGVGRHMEALIQTAPEKLIYWGRICLIVIPIIYALASTLPKLVILAVYLRLFVQKWTRIACYATGAVLVAAFIVNLILSISQCSPPDYVWNKTIADGHCHNDIQAHIRWGQFPNIVTDVAMLILPLPVVWNLHVSSKEKIGLMATFIVGSFGLITATVRFVEFLDIAAFVDPSWKSNKLLIWACIEPGVYLIAACLLACRPLLHQIIHISPLFRFRSRVSTTTAENHSDLFLKAPKPTIRDIELQESPRHTYRGFKSLHGDDDLETLTTRAPATEATGNYSQASGPGRQP